MLKKYVVNALFLCVLSGCSDMQTTTLPDPVQPLAMKSVEADTTSSPLPPPPPIVSAKYATLTNLRLNNIGNEITIKPGSSIGATLNYAYHCPSCKSTVNNQIIIGLARRSAQACIYDGGIEGQGTAQFELKVPAKPGKYEIRFRVLQARDCNEALKVGWGDDNSPSRETTIGKIVASKKANV